ncbi:MAG: cupin domain-containing protein [Anaerolineales bacterium]|nr:cupin domain-containing protein [Anaerolineales bacterium]
MSTLPSSQKFSLLHLTTFQDGAIVSRQITKTKSGNVTLFAFDAGQELSEHTAPFDALVHILEGEAEIRICGQVYRLSASEAILMPANEPHAVRATQRLKLLLTMLRT